MSLDPTRCTFPLLVASGTSVGGEGVLGNEAFARIKVDQLLRDAGWNLTDGRSTRLEYVLDDGGRADYVLFDRVGRDLAVLEVNRTSVDLSSGGAQAEALAAALSAEVFG